MCDSHRHTQRLAVMGCLAVGIAHDLNNLLTIISGYSDCLLSELAPSDPRRADLIDIGSAAQIGATLTRRLLAFGRQRATTPRVVIPSHVVAESKGLLRRLVAPGVTLDVDIAPATGAVLADEGELEQILMNLAVNARDAMPSGGTLAVEIANVDVPDECAGNGTSIPCGRYVMLAVHDTGVGISAEVRERIFEPFFTTKTDATASGLGLATVDAIVGERAGFVRVRSGLGVGTTIRVYLPRVDEGTLPDAAHAAADGTA